MNEQKIELLSFAVSAVHIIHINIRLYRVKKISNKNANMFFFDLNFCCSEITKRNKISYLK